ncbi:hypothetical protein BFX40_10980 [Mesorhizobium sp. SEMIA 3007]|nr:hypothetical protein BFX40_10980 [Mesorhizobium sp. SEMIA 3007]
MVSDGFSSNPVHGLASQARTFDWNIQNSHQGAPLLRPEQVRLLDEDYEIVLIKGLPPLQLRKVRYF